jgi:tetratricopeptide (TPR) repeat protein
MNVKTLTYFLSCLSIVLCTSHAVANGEAKQLQPISMDRLERIHSSTHPNKDLLLAQELYNQKLYFAMIPYIGDYIIRAQEITPENERLLEETLLKTGTNSLAGLSNNHLSRHRSPSLALVLGLKLFDEKKYQDAINALSVISDSHRFAPEALMIKGSSYNLLNQFSKANNEYERCINIASGLESKARHPRLARYYGIVKESCMSHKARALFKQKDFQGATLAYEKISKNSYLWPYLLLERAWSSYYQEDYNRTLGLLVTYRSPLLNSYFFPEAEVLTALSYHRLCLYGDAMKTIEQYHQVYKSRSDALRSILMQQRNSDTYFLQMMLSPIETQEKMNPFIRNLITQIRKKVKFSVDLVNYQASREELERWKHLFESNKSPLVQNLARESQRSVQWRTVHLNHFIKQHMFSFINDIHRFSFELFNIQLEIMSSQRDLLYRNQALVSDRSRGSLDNVRRTQRQHFFEFTGEFWADELGDYSFGLQSNCDVVKRETASQKNNRRTK